MGISVRHSTTDQTAGCGCRGSPHLGPAPP